MGILFAHILWTPVRILRSLFRGDVLLMQGYVLALLKLPIIMKHRVIERTLFRMRDDQLEVLQ